MNCAICKQTCASSGTDNEQKDCYWFTEIAEQKNPEYERLAMQIVNHINESTGVSVETRQSTNDANFDYVYYLIYNKFYRW